MKSIFDQDYPKNKYEVIVVDDNSTDSTLLIARNFPVVLLENDAKNAEAGKAIGLKHAKGEVYASSLAKSIDCTYSHVVKVLQEMEKAGLVNFEKQGRLKLLSLTKTGAEIASHIDGIRTRL